MRTTNKDAYKFMNKNVPCALLNCNNTWQVVSTEKKAKCCWGASLRCVLQLNDAIIRELVLGE